MAAAPGAPSSVEFTVIIQIEPDGSEFHAYCPALKGLHVGGSTEQEALRAAAEAAGAYLESLMKNHEPIPLGVEITRKPSPGTTTHRETLQVPVPA